MGHRCHANGCTKTGHAELPFCKDHFQKIPERVRKRIWKIRWPAMMCGICNCGRSLTMAVEKNLWPGHYEWFQLVNKGIAYIMFSEFGDHDCPSNLVDEDGFCWGCGIHDAAKTFDEVARWRTSDG